VLKNLTIVPLFSWYDFSFGPCSDYLKDRWMDFYKCRWGRPYDDLKAFSEREKAIADYFHALNEPHLKIKNKKIISFSHFMPRIDVMPEHIPTVHQKVYPVLGSWALDKQIRTLGSVLHIYGHSHVNRHELIEGVTYVNNAYGNPGEESIASKQLKCLMEI
jgi:Icc-related predicted phosphoesterase